MSDLTPDADPYDVAEVVAAARAADPGLPDGNARVLAEEAVGHLQDGVADVPELARRLLAAHPEWGATAANVVARASCVACGMVS